MDCIHLSMGEGPLEEGGASGTYLHWSEISQGRLGQTSLLWDHMHGMEYTCEKTDRSGEIWDGATLRETVVTSDSGVIWNDLPLFNSPVGPTEVVVHPSPPYDINCLVNKICLLSLLTRKKGNCYCHKMNPITMTICQIIN